jgi:nucleoside-diphosphate-sugar epimerase
LPETGTFVTVARGPERGSAEDVVRTDLEHIVGSAGRELAAMAGKRVLVTGGAGFLGYYLVQGMLAWNAAHSGEDGLIDVTVLDSNVRGMPDWLLGHSGFGLSFVQHDIRLPLPDDLGHFEYVVHAAGIASPTYYRMHPIETMDANITGLRFLLDRSLAASNEGLATDGFLFFSSSEIYGDPPAGDIPTPETYRGNVSCTGPRACYDESKRYGETLCVNFARQYGLPVKIARPFNNYGPGLKITDRRVIPDFARDVLDGKDMALLSDGSATRTFCYAADAIVGYLKVLVGGRGGEPYNIGTESPEISMTELAERIVKIAGELFDYQGSVVYSRSQEPDYLVDNPSRRCPLIEKASTELGYQPAVALDEGLTRSLLWYAEHRAGADA